MNPLLMKMAGVLRLIVDGFIPDRGQTQSLLADVDAALGAPEKSVTGHRWTFCPSCGAVGTNDASQGGNEACWHCGACGFTECISVDYDTYEAERKQAFEVGWSQGFCALARSADDIGTERAADYAHYITRRDRTVHVKVVDAHDTQSLAALRRD